MEQSKTKEMTPIGTLLEWIAKEQQETHTQGYVSALDDFHQQLTALLPAEREFAADTFRAGSRHEFNTSHPDFTTFYSQYENDTP